jgi:hypothetical protein
MKNVIIRFCTKIVLNKWIGYKILGIFLSILLTKNGFTGEWDISRGNNQKWDGGKGERHFGCSHSHSWKMANWMEINSQKSRQNCSLAVNSLGQKSPLLRPMEYLMNFGGSQWWHWISSPVRYKIEDSFGLELRNNNFLVGADSEGKCQFLDNRKRKYVEAGCQLYLAFFVLFPPTHFSFHRHQCRSIFLPTYFLGMWCVPQSAMGKSGKKLDGKEKKSWEKIKFDGILSEFYLNKYFPIHFVISKRGRKFDEEFRWKNGQKMDTKRNGKMDGTKIVLASILGYGKKNGGNWMKKEEHGWMARKHPFSKNGKLKLMCCWDWTKIETNRWMEKRQFGSINCVLILAHISERHWRIWEGDMPFGNPKYSLKSGLFKFYESTLKKFIYWVRFIPPVVRKVYFFYYA